MIDMFLMDSKGDVPRVFQACVLHASTTNPAAVRGFRRQFSKAVFQGHDVSKFFRLVFCMLSRVFSGLCFACFGHESCCCSRLSQAVFQGHLS